jgi:O-antigen/teichoic acid export membrane protein
MAYRVVDVATIPVTALDAAALPRYFRQSGEGGISVRNLSVRLAGRAALLGLVAAVCMFLAAPLVPLIIGKGFTQSIFALRWLCLLPVFRGVHQLTGSAVTGLGFQRYRTRGQIAAAVFNFGLNLWLIPRSGWHGAAWASLATDAGLAIVNLFMLQSLQHRAPETSSTMIQ